ncbi:serine hydrolase [Streptomyces sp. NPDC008141]|uniref:serine hydrolase n=1 Tax=Streptomyces sp. NPDC008141 TaxID=3364815 RepID=UPI0036EE8343
MTKTFVATVVLQLVAEGRLSLDDTVERRLPGVVSGNGNDGSRITVRNLLRHRRRRAAARGRTSRPRAGGPRPLRRGRMTRLSHPYGRITL